jgi:hypothetical protein
MCLATFTDKKTGNRVGISRHSVDQIEENLKNDSTFIHYSLLGEQKKLEVQESFDDVMAVLYPPEEEHKEGMMPYVS